MAPNPKRTKKKPIVPKPVASPKKARHGDDDESVDESVDLSVDHHV
eukprot:gene12849-biopygen8864